MHFPLLLANSRLISFGHYIHPIHGRIEELKYL